MLGVVLAGASERVSSIGDRIDLQMQLKPLEELDAKPRKRALVRRGHLERLRASAIEVVQQRVVRPAAIEMLVAEGSSVDA